MSFDLEVDASGLKCPLPILRCKKALAGLTEHQILKITATDPGAVKDFQAFCKQTGHEMLSLDEVENRFVFHIKKHLRIPS